MGRKPATTHSTHWHDNLHQLVDMDGATAKDLCQIYQMRYGLNLCAALCYGYALCIDDQMGALQVTRLNAAPIEGNRLGWQAVPGLRTDDPDLWTARYGHGLRSILVVANPMSHRRRVRVKLGNSRLGPHAYAMAGYFGDPLATRVAEEVTIFDLDLPRWSPWALRPSLGLRGFAGVVHATPKRSAQSQSGVAAPLCHRTPKRSARSHREPRRFCHQACRLKNTGRS